MFLLYSHVFSYFTMCWKVVHIPSTYAVFRFLCFSKRNAVHLHVFSYCIPTSDNVNRCYLRIICIRVYMLKLYVFYFKKSFKIQYMCGRWVFKSFSNGGWNPHSRFYPVIAQRICISTHIFVYVYHEHSLYKGFYNMALPYNVWTAIHIT